MVNWTIPCQGVSLKGVLAPKKAVFRAKNRLKTAENGDFHLLSILECFFEKMEESRPPLKLKNNGGLLSAIFSENHSKCLKSNLAFLDFGLPKNAILRHLVFFRKNCRK